MDKYYYEYKDDGDVKYCYPGTQILVNKLDIRDGQQLSAVEREISIVKAAVLADDITGNFDFHILRVFTSSFLMIFLIGQGRYALLILQKEIFSVWCSLLKCSFLKGKTDIEYVSKRIAYYLSELNVIYPFGDRNGRMSRLLTLL